MKYGQILMNSDRGAVKIIINFSPRPPFCRIPPFPVAHQLPHPRPCWGWGRNTPPSPHFPLFCPGPPRGKGPRAGAAWGQGGSGGLWGTGAASFGSWGARAALWKGDRAQTRSPPSPKPQPCSLGIARQRGIGHVSRQHQARVTRRRRHPQGGPRGGHGVTLQGGFRRP